MTTVNRRYNDGEAEKLKAAGRRGMTAASRRDDGNKPKGRGGKQGKHDNGKPKKLSAASESHN